jgi:hypothetical protein
MFILLPVFIAEITARAFIIADSNKRRTLSRSDISKALSQSDQFDFLIDIVPREESAAPGGATRSKMKKAEQVSCTTQRNCLKLAHSTQPDSREESYGDEEQEADQFPPPAALSKVCNSDVSILISLTPLFSYKV